MVFNSESYFACAARCMALTETHGCMSYEFNKRDNTCKMSDERTVENDSSMDSMVEVYEGRPVSML